MQINTQNFAPSPSASASATQNNQGSERDLFMALLVAQLKNQDPLEPKDGTQFVAQLAQFNSLDQLMSIRESLERLTAITESRNQFTNPAKSLDIK